MTIYINNTKQGADDMVRFLQAVQNGEAVITAVRQDGDTVRIMCK